MSYEKGYIFYQHSCIFFEMKYVFCQFQTKNKTTANLYKDIKIYKSILKDSWMYQLSIFLTFTICLSVFPAVTYLIQPIQKGKVKISQASLISSQFNYIGSRSYCALYKDMLKLNLNFRWHQDSMGRNLLRTGLLLCSFQFWWLSGKSNGYHI